MRLWRLVSITLFKIISFIVCYSYWIFIMYFNILVAEQKKGQAGSSGVTQGGTEAGGSSQVTDLSKD